MKVKASRMQSAFYCNKSTTEFVQQKNMDILQDKENFSATFDREHTNALQHRAHDDADSDGESLENPFILKGPFPSTDEDFRSGCEDNAGMTCLAPSHNCKLPSFPVIPSSQKIKDISMLNRNPKTPPRF